MIRRFWWHVSREQWVSAFDWFTKTCRQSRNDDKRAPSSQRLFATPCLFIAKQSPGKRVVDVSLSHLVLPYLSRVKRVISGSDSNNQTSHNSLAWHSTKFDLIYCRGNESKIWRSDAITKTLPAEWYRNRHGFIDTTQVCVSDSREPDLVPSLFKNVIMICWHISEELFAKRRSSAFEKRRAGSVERWWNFREKN